MWFSRGLRSSCGSAVNLVSCMEALKSCCDLRGLAVNGGSAVKFFFVL